MAEYDEPALRWPDRGIPGAESLQALSSRPGAVRPGCAGRQAPATPAALLPPQPGARATAPPASLRGPPAVPIAQRAHVWKPVEHRLYRVRSSTQASSDAPELSWRSTSLDTLCGDDSRRVARVAFRPGYRKRAAGSVGTDVLAQTNRQRLRGKISLAVDPTCRVGGCLSRTRLHRYACGSNAFERSGWRTSSVRQSHATVWDYQ